MTQGYQRRTRIAEVEDCWRCGAPMWTPCVTYQRTRKVACMVECCARCGAQLKLCACGGPWRSARERMACHRAGQGAVTQGTLFGDE